MLKKHLIISLALFLAGCLPIYAPKDINKTVSVNVAELIHPEIKVDKGWQRFVPDKSHEVKIEYGREVQIANNYFNYQVDSNTATTTTCFPIISLLPQKGKNYYINFSIIAEKCKLSLIGS